MMRAMRNERKEQRKAPHQRAGKPEKPCGVHSQQEGDDAVQPVQRIRCCGLALVGQLRFGQPKARCQADDKQAVPRHFGEMAASATLCAGAAERR